MRRFARRTLDTHGTYAVGLNGKHSYTVDMSPRDGALGNGKEGLEEPLISSSPQSDSGSAAGPLLDPECQPEEVPPAFNQGHRAGSSWQAVTTALLSLQLGWGLWLFPSDYSRIGWCAHGLLVSLALLTAYSGTLFSRLYQAVPGTVLFSDVGRKAAGTWGASLVSCIVYSLDATRCVILHLAATQSLRHMYPTDAMPPLWQCGLVVFVGASILVQVRSMAEMSWVFMTGTASQLVAVAIVVFELISNPNPQAETRWVEAKQPSDLVPAVVAFMNMVFAFGGQFAFTEIMGSMKQPKHFSRAVSVCTVIMASLYGGLGTIGYWSQGSSITGIVVFSLPEGPRARIAAGCILVQATAQYLINVNVWVHNLLVIMARRDAAADGTSHEHVRCSTDHCKWRWLGMSIFVVAYSYVISISLPFFTTLVGLVTSVTYLACAYTLPAWFMLKLIGRKLPEAERVFLLALIPLSIIVSLVGLWASISALVNDLGGGGEGVGAPGPRIGGGSSHGWA